jgi:2-dehydropantoate 2-reductase
MKKTNISIVGLGGVGGYFGFKLARKYQQHSDIDIAFVARLATYEAVKKNGLTLVSPEHADNTVKPDQLFKSVKEITRPDVIIICVKEYDLEKICTDLKDKVKDDSVILPLMNGVDIYERIRAIIPNGIVLPSCVYVAAHIKEKGVVEHKGNAGRIIIGNDPDKQAYKLRWLIQLLQQAGIDVTDKENAYSDIWTKFIFIASFGLVTPARDDDYERN